MSDSRIKGLFRLPVAERVSRLVAAGFLDRGDADRLLDGEPLLPLARADRMVENVLGVFGLPFAVAPNFMVNGKDCLVPMVVEEPSIVAGVSSAAGRFRRSNGFAAESDAPLLIGQVQLTGMRDSDAARAALEAARDDILERANALQPRLLERGGGARDIEVFVHDLDGSDCVVLHLLVDTADAMGANLVNTMCEGIADFVAEVAAATANLRILSNLADRCIVSASGKLSVDQLRHDGVSGEAVRDAIVLADKLAAVDPYRAATHNKGIMNGIDALAIATGNDWRAIEAGAHAFAARDGRYRGLTRWSVGPEGDLLGRITLPLRVGVVGGSLLANPGARIGLALTGAGSATELAELMACVGLAQNFAALRALVTHGIQQGHMRLHARSVAATAGVTDDRFEQVVAGLIESGEIKTWKAEEIAAGISASGGLDGDPAFSTGTGCGKVILFGEHAVVHGRHALALPITDAIRVGVRAAAGSNSLSPGNGATTVTWRQDDEELPDAARVVEQVRAKLGAGDGAFDIRVESRIPAAMGLGSSAAFAVAVIRAFDALLETGLDDRDINDIAFACEELTHGAPSGIDNSVATFGRPILFCRSESPQMSPVDIAELPPLIVASSGMPGMTAGQVAGVRKRFERCGGPYTRIFDQMDALCMAGLAALEARAFDELGCLMNVCHGLLNAIEVSTPRLERMIGIARNAGAVGAKLTGAGGGGSIIALCPGNVAAVGEALTQSGYPIIEMTQAAVQ